MLEQSDVDLAGGGESILCLLGEFPDVASMFDLFSTVNPGFYYLSMGVSEWQLLVLQETQVFCRLSQLQEIKYLPKHS